MYKGNVPLELVKGVWNICSCFCVSGNLPSYASWYGGQFYQHGNEGDSYLLESLCYCNCLARVTLYIVSLAVVVHALQRA